jgi:hypothetical protein
MITIVKDTEVSLLRCVRLEDFIAESTGIAVFWNVLVCGMVRRYVTMAWKKIILVTFFRVEIQ